MKIYVGRFPKEHYPYARTDAWLFTKLQEYTIAQLAKKIEAGYFGDMPLHTYNVLLMNYFSDEYAKENIYFYCWPLDSDDMKKFLEIDATNIIEDLYGDRVEGTVMKCFDLAMMKEKLTMMGVGEAIADSSIFLI